MKAMNLLALTMMSIVLSCHHHISSSVEVVEAAEIRVLALNTIMFGQSFVADFQAAYPEHTIALATMTLGQIYSEIDRDITQDNLYDVYLVGNLDTRYGLNGYARDLTEDVRTMDKFKWSSIPSKIRDEVTLDGHVYAIPIDSNPVPMMYRTDLIDSPPTTWEELIDVAKQFHGQDLNNDTVPDYGTCIITSLRWQLSLFTIANSIFRYTGSKREGFLFDVNSDDTVPMEAVVDSPGWQYAFEIAQQLFNYSQKTLLGPGLAPLNLWRNGSCATYITFSAAAEQVAKPLTTSSFNPNITFDIRGKTGVTRPPGSTKVYNRATKQLETCNPQLCPFEEFGNVNRPTYHDGLISATINARTPHLTAAQDFASFVSSNIDPRVAGVINPFRSEHWNISWWMESKPRPWFENEARAYTETVFDIITSDRTTTKPRLPIMSIWNGQFDAAMQEVVRLSPYENSQRSISEILASLETNMITAADGVGYNLDALERFLRLDLSLPPRSETEKSTFPAWGIILIVFFILLVICFITFIAVSFWLKGASARMAPKDSNSPCTMIIVSVNKCSELWDHYPSLMPEALAQYRKTVRKIAKKHGCYEVKRIGETNYVLAAKDVSAAVKMSTALQTEISRARWSFLARRQEAENQQSHASGEFANKASQSQSRREKSQLSGRNNESGTYTGKYFDDRSSNRSVRSTRSSVQSKSFHGGNDDASGAAAKKLSHFTTSIGLQHGAVRIFHDEELNTYDYAGDALSDAAILADLAASWQIIAGEGVFDALPQTSTKEYTLSQLCTWQLVSSSEQQQLYGIQSSTMPKVTRVPDAKQRASLQEGGSDAVAALEQATSGLASKRVTVLAIRLRGATKPLTGVAAAKNKDLMIDAVSTVHEILEDVTASSKGHIQSSLSGDLVITFNAASNVASAKRRAVVTALELHALVTKNFPEWRFQAGLASGLALVGKMGGEKTRQETIYGGVVDQAIALCGISNQYPGVPCLATASMKDDLLTCAFYQHLDVVPLPVTTTGGGGAKTPVLTADSPPTSSSSSTSSSSKQPIIGIMSSTSAAGGGNNSNAASGIVEDDEWMYELEAAAMKDPYLSNNRAWEAFLSGDLEKTRKIEEERLAKVVIAGKRGNNTKATMSPTAATTAANVSKQSLKSDGDGDNDDDEGSISTKENSISYTSLSVSGANLTENTHDEKTSASLDNNSSSSFYCLGHKVLFSVVIPHITSKGVAPEDYFAPQGTFFDCFYL